MDNPDVYTTPAHYERSASTNSNKGSNQFQLVLFVGGVIAALTVVFLFVRGGKQETPPPINEAVVVGVGTPTTVPTPTPTIVPECVQVTATHQSTINDLVKRLKYDQAADIAVVAYRDPRVCEEAQQDFGKQYVTNALEGLYTRIDDHSERAQQDAVDDYETIRRTAKQFGVEQPNPLEVANRGGQSGLHALVLASLDQALLEGSFDTTDQALIKRYGSALYNLGYWYTQDSTSPTYHLGLEYLSAAHQTEQRYKTGDALPWRRLIELCGPDESKWPEPKKTPLL